MANIKSQGYVYLGQGQGQRLITGLRLSGLGLGSKVRIRVQRLGLVTGLRLSGLGSGFKG